MAASEDEYWMPEWDCWYKTVPVFKFPPYNHRTEVQAQQGIVLTSSGEPCFGQTVTLTCTHPDPLQDLDKYQPVLIGFIENGGVLDFLGDLATAQRFTQTRLNSTASNVSFTVTEEDHANGVITCSCFLALKDGGGREESDPIAMNVEETIQPPTTVSKPDSTSGLLQWRPSSNCSNYRYIFTLTWVRIGDSNTGTVSTEENRYDFTGMPGGEYTVSLKARVTNFNLSESQPVNDCWITIIHPPTLVSKPTSTSGLLQWNSPSSSCSNYQFIFTLTWVRIEDGSTGTVSTEENRYDFTGMTGGNYTATVTAKIAGLNLDESEPLSVTLFTTPNMTGSVCILCFAIPLVLILLLIVFIVLIVVIYSLCRNRQKRVSHSHCADPVPTLQEYSEAPFKKQEAEDVELGQTRQELDKKQEAENDQIQYAAIDFSGQRPIAPPSLETVVYTETVEQFRKARKNRPIPPLPPAKTEEEEEEERKLAQEAAEITADFKAQVVAILQASKLVYRSLDPEEPVVGTYQKKTFVANFVHAPGGKEILSSEVEAIIKDRELQSTDKGFLVATTDSISGPWLEHLEKHNCHFIGLSRKGGVKKEMLLKKLSFCFPESSSI